jgi:hypothetical protein
MKPATRLAHCSRINAGVLYFQAGRPADNLDFEERLRRLEEDRAALVRKVGFLRGREAERDQKKARDRTFAPFAFVLIAIYAVVLFTFLGNRYRQPGPIRRAAASLGIQSPADNGDPPSLVEDDAGRRRR